MKNLLISVLALALCVSFAQAQSTGSPFPDQKFIPRTLSAGTSMSARTDAAALDDTTQSIRVGGFTAVYIHIVTAANDSASVVLSYACSNDGATFGAYTTFDSLSTTGTVGANKAFALPAGGLGAEFVRIRVKGSVSAVHSTSPATTVTTVIRKKLY